MIKFVNLPDRSHHPDLHVERCAGLGPGAQLRRPVGGERDDWNVRNRNNQVVASGVYFYHLEAGDARRVGRFTVVNFAAVVHHGGRGRTPPPLSRRSETMSRNSRTGFGPASAALLALAAWRTDGRRPRRIRTTPPYGTTSAEFLLFGAGARGTALGGAFAAIATDVSSLYYNPGGAALIDRSGRHRQHLRLCRRDPIQLGRHRLPLLRRLPHLRPADRHLRVRQPAGVHRRSAGRHRRGLLGQPDLRRR